MNQEELLGDGERSCGALVARIRRCKPERDQASVTVSTPAWSKADQTFDGFEMNAVAVGKINCCDAADGLLPIRHAVTFRRFAPFSRFFIRHIRLGCDGLRMRESHLPGDLWLHKE